MTTRKKMRSRRHRHRHRHRHRSNKILKNKGEKVKNFSRRRHRRRHRKTTVSSWDKHYNYESNTTSEVHKMNNKSDKDDDVQAVHGLKDFLQGKK